MQKPVYHEYDEYRNRLSKLEEIQNLNIQPYPAKFTPDSHALDLENIYQGEPVGHSEDGALGTTPKVTVAGRLVLFRAMGKNAFAHLQDATGRIQVMFNKDLTKVHGLSESANDLSAMKFIEKKFDLGDLLGVTGHLFKTQKGELTIFAKEVTLLCKTLLPLPDKNSGFTNFFKKIDHRWL